MYADRLSASAKDKRDFYADWAEFYVYIGETSAALNTLQLSDPGEDWHPWVHAFALHQHAFVSTYPNVPDPQLYSDSNNVLRAWNPTGSMPDAKLIEAANYAGLNDLPSARNALADFLAANPKWSIVKEKRGPFIRRLPLNNDPAGGSTAAREKRVFRRLYAKHFFDNLRKARRGPADLRESEIDDGPLLPGSNAEVP